LATVEYLDASNYTPAWPQPPSGEWTASSFSESGNGIPQGAVGQSYWTNHTAIGFGSFQSPAVPFYTGGAGSGSVSSPFCGSSVTLKGQVNVYPDVTGWGYYQTTWVPTYYAGPSGPPFNNQQGGPFNVTKGYIFPWEFVNIGINGAGSTQGETEYYGDSHGSSIDNGGGRNNLAWANMSITSPNNMEIIAASCGNVFGQCTPSGLPFSKGCARAGTTLSGLGSSVVYYICNNVTVGSYNVSIAAPNYTMPWATGTIVHNGYSAMILNESTNVVPSLSLDALVYQNTTYSATLSAPRISGVAASQATYICAVTGYDLSDGTPQGWSITSSSNFGAQFQNGGCQVSSGDAGLVSAAIAVGLPYGGPSETYAQRGGEGGSGTGSGPFSIQFNVQNSNGKGGIGVAVITCTGGICQPASSAIGNSDGTSVGCNDVARTIGRDLNSSVDIVECDFTGKNQEYTLQIAGSATSETEGAQSYVFSAPYS
jgi:hypothetical protein